MSRRIRWGAVAGARARARTRSGAPMRAASRSGFMDFEPFEGAENALWYRRDRRPETPAWCASPVGGRVSPRPAGPALRDPRDPADPALSLDAARHRGPRCCGARASGHAHASVRARLGRGSRPRPHRPPRHLAPRPRGLRRLRQAAARRYSGTFPDPLRPGATLPRVRYWQPWNEPNLPTYLTPQWTGDPARTRPASPAWYRRLLNAAYIRLKRVDPGNRVIAAGTAPVRRPGRRRQPHDPRAVPARAALPARAGAAARPAAAPGRSSTASTTTPTPPAPRRSPPSCRRTSRSPISAS